MKRDDWNDGPLDENAPDSQIEAMMEQLGVEKAPASLTRRLMRIPNEERASERRRKRFRFRWPEWPAPRWVMAPALAAVPLAILTVVLMQPRQPSEAEIEQARQDLSVAFAYLDKAGYRTGREIHSVLGGELRHSVKDTLSKHIPFTEQSLKEDTT